VVKFGVVDGGGGGGGEIESENSLSFVVKGGGM
jgi:hypothetical protein